MRGARGERVIQAGEREITVLFTNRAILSAEQQLGKGIIQILNDFQSGGGYTELVALLRVGMEAARQDARAGFQYPLLDRSVIRSVLRFAQMHVF